MANWQRTVRLNPEWQLAKDGGITIQQLASSMVAKLKLIKPFAPDPLCADPIDCELEEIIERLQFLADDSAADREEFDDIMSDLYDWGDISLGGAWPGKKVCWIDTISGSPSVALQQDQTNG
jgi:hypothetical protein